MLREGGASSNRRCRWLNKFCCVRCGRRDPSNSGRRMPCSRRIGYAACRNDRARRRVVLNAREILQNAHMVLAIICVQQSGIDCKPIAGGMDQLDRQRRSRVSDRRQFALSLLRGVVELRPRRVGRSENRSGQDNCRQNQWKGPKHLRSPPGVDRRESGVACLTACTSPSKLRPSRCLTETKIRFRGTESRGGRRCKQSQRRRQRLQRRRKRSGSLFTSAAA